LVNRDGQTKVRLPTQYRTKKNTKKILKKNGDKLDYQIIKCIICGKRKMEKYDLQDEKGNRVTINKCKQCNFINSSEVIAYNSDGNDPYADPNVTYFNPVKPKPLDDKSI
jgi:hypothetical protein